MVLVLLLRQKRGLRPKIGNHGRAWPQIDPLRPAEQAILNAATRAEHQAMLCRAALPEPRHPPLARHAFGAAARIIEDNPTGGLAIGTHTAQKIGKIGTII